MSAQCSGQHSDEDGAHDQLKPREMADGICPVHDLPKIISGERQCALPDQLEWHLAIGAELVTAAQAPGRGHDGGGAEKIAGGMRRTLREAVGWRPRRQMLRAPRVEATLEIGGGRTGRSNRTAGRGCGRYDAPWDGMHPEQSRRRCEITRYSRRRRRRR